MGRTFLEHPGGTRLYSCVKCDTVLTNKSQLISMRFTGATGRAFLFHKVVNITFSDVQDRVMLTGRHMVRDVSCKKCDAKLGWMYEFAVEESQRYKGATRLFTVENRLDRHIYHFGPVYKEEGRVILERALVSETDGIDEIGDN